MDTVTSPDASPSARRALRAVIQSRPTVGALCQIPDAFAAEIMASAGFDWLCIDMQHGLVGYDQMVSMIRAIDGWRIPAVVRVPCNEPSTISRALDAGATGVVVPMVNTVEEAAAAVAATRYAPDGVRSWGPTRAARVHGRFGLDTAAEHSVCIVMIETPEAVAAIDAIVAVPGVDAVLVGTTDLAIAVGEGVDRTGSGATSALLIPEVGAACAAKGVLAGIACGGAEAVQKWADVGFRMFLVRSDVAYMSSAAERLVAAAVGVLRAEHRAPAE